MIKYEFNNEKYYKDGQEIDKALVKSEIGIAMYRLKKYGYCNIRSQSPAKKDIKDQDKKNYKATYDIKNHKGEIRHELWRLNKRYGYFNLVCCLKDRSEDTLNKAIQEDIENQKQQIKIKSKTKEVDDADI